MIDLPKSSWDGSLVTTNDVDDVDGTIQERCSSERSLAKLSLNATTSRATGKSKNAKLSRSCVSKWSEAARERSISLGEQHFPCELADA